MRDGVDEAAVLFVQPDCANEEGSVQDHADNNRREKKESEEQEDSLPQTEDDPADVKRNRQGHQGYAQHEEKCDCLSAARNTHGFLERLNWIVPRGAGFGAVDAC